MAGPSRLTVEFECKGITKKRPSQTVRIVRYYVQLKCNLVSIFAQIRATICNLEVID